jgi:hypothetical protein
MSFQYAPQSPKLLLQNVYSNVEAELQTRNKPIHKKFLFRTLLCIERLFQDGLIVHLDALCNIQLPKITEQCMP